MAGSVIRLQVAASASASAASSIISMHHVRNKDLFSKGSGSTAYAICGLDALGGRMSVHSFNTFIDSGIASYSMKPNELKQAIEQCV